MSIKNKTVILIIAVVLLLSAVLYFTAQNILFRHFDYIENVEASANVKRVKKTFFNYFKRLGLFAVDYAHWDDTYKFAVDTNNTYLKSNMMDDTFITNKLSSIIILDTNGHSLFEKYFDVEHKQSIGRPSRLSEYFTSSRVMFKPGEPDAAKSGIIMLPTEIFFYTARPILKSDATGPLRGTIIMGRFLNKYGIEEISQEADYNISFFRTDAELPPAMKSIIPARDNSDTLMVKPLNSHIIDGYFFLSDITSKASLIIRIQMNRQINQGQSTWMYLMGFYFFIVICFAALIIFLLNKFLLSRIADLNSAVNNISLDSYANKRIVIKGSDEISNLGVAINKMLAAVEGSFFVQQTNEMLETRVRERTTALLDANKSLKEKVTQITLMDEQLQSNYENLNNIYKFSDNLSKAVHLEEIYRLANDSASQSVRADHSALLLFDAEGRLKFKHHDGLSEKFRNGFEQYFGQISSSASLRFCFVPDIHNSTEFVQLFPLFESENLASFGLIPLVNKGKEIGKLLICFNSIRELNSQEEEVLKITADHVASAIGRIVFENILKTSEDKFSKAFRTSPDAININRLKDGLFIEINDGFTSLTGYSHKEIAGRTAAEINILGSEENRKRLLHELAQKGELSSWENEFIMKNGEKKTGLMSARIIEVAGERCYISITRDITERKRIELIRAVLYKISKAINGTTGIQQLYASIHEALSGVINTDNFFFAIYNKENDVIFFPYFSSSSDMNYEIHKASASKTPVAQVILEAKSILLKQEDLISGDGSVDRHIPKVWLGYPLALKHNLAGAICFQSFTDGNLYSCNDVETIKALSEQIVIAINSKYDEEELIKAKNSAEQSDRLKSEFLAQMSHEIRTPINTILSFTSLLKESTQDTLDEDLKPSFKIIENGGRRLIRTIDLMLNMSQIKSGYTDLRITAIDLTKEVIETVMLDFYLSAKEKGLNLKFNNFVKQANIMGDLNTITQVFVQLIDNAIKYTLSGEIEISQYKNENDHISVDIKDTGIGISQEYLPKLFSAFSQEETGYTRRFEGNGLGLALAKKYCELNNAELSVQSEKGQGSIFTVTFKGNKG